MITGNTLRADIGIYRRKDSREIYCGLISGYTAKLATFAREESLDKMTVTSGYHGEFHRLVESVNIGIYSQRTGGLLTIGKTHQDVDFGVPRVACYPCVCVALADKPPVAPYADNRNSS